MSYEIKGRILEVCDCNVLCPCWIGEDPDGGTCDASLAYHIDEGTVDGIDVSGRTIAVIVHIPGNILQGNLRGLWFVDEDASPEQVEALGKAFTGQLGGPLADTAQLYAETPEVTQAPITFTVKEGKGTLRIGNGNAPILDAEMVNYSGPTGAVTTLNESIFTTIPGSPAYVGKATHFKRNSTEYGLKDVNLTDHNAIQGMFHFVA